MRLTSHQRYVSNELTHFVGKNLKTDEERFALLVRIIREGILRPGRVGHFLTGFTMAIPVRGGTLSTNQAVTSTVVCFCDIPVSDLGIHMKKYKPFGIAFEKRLLIAKGANPVFYIASDARAPYTGATKAKHAFDSLYRTHRKLSKDLTKFLEHQLPPQKGVQIVRSGGHGVPLAERLLWRVGEFTESLDDLLFSNVKFFHSDRSETSTRNFYMEREWRVRGAVQFGIHDVARVIVPKVFAGRFRQAFPSYKGQLEFSS
jgi:hypothetical protein